MEFLRFGSSIPGSYWGCCAVDIIQNFSYEPSTPASIQIVSGDNGTPCGDKYLGLTYRDIFLQRLRIGTFGSEDMPNHVFLAIMTDSQLKTDTGKAWLKLLKETGFEFIRATNNSVYTGTSMSDEPPYAPAGHHTNYLFGLFRNIGKGALADPFSPPEEWTDLDGGKIPACNYLDPNDVSTIVQNHYEFDKKVWESIGRVVFRTEKEVETAGVPVTLAGIRTEYLQQTKEQRQTLLNRTPNGEVVHNSDPFDCDNGLDASYYEDEDYEDKYCEEEC